jgi:aquaporin Z
MAHFNPAVTLGFLITGHITKLQLLQYFAAEITGALLASLFVMSVIGTEASLGANAPDYSYPLPLVFGIEVLATALLMAVIFLVVYTKGMRRLGGLAIGGMVGFDIFFLVFISGASMNPARSLAPALSLVRSAICGSTGLQHLLEALLLHPLFVASLRTKHI